MKHRRPKFQLKFRPKEDRREEHESKEGVFFLADLFLGNATTWEVVIAAIKGVAYVVIGGAVVYVLVLILLLLPLLF